MNNVDTVSDKENNRFYRNYRSFITTESQNRIQTHGNAIKIYCCNNL